MKTKNEETVSQARNELRYVIERMEYIKNDEDFLLQQRDSREYILDVLIEKLERVQKTLK